MQCDAKNEFISHGQDRFIINSNSLVEKLESSGAFSKYSNSTFKLPRLPIDGVCNALTFSLAEHIRRGEEQTFFKLYDEIAGGDPTKLASAIIAVVRHGNNESPKMKYVNLLIDFIFRIFILQQRHREYFQESIPSIYRDQDVYDFSEPNHQRIGNFFSSTNQGTLIATHRYDNSKRQFLELISKLQEGESYIFGIKTPYKQNGHSFIVYMLNSTLFLFEPNYGRKAASNPEDIVGDIYYCANKMTIKPRISDIFKTCDVKTKLSSLFFPKFTMSLIDDLVSPPSAIPDEVLRARLLISGVYWTASFVPSPCKRLGNSIAGISLN